MTTVGIVSPGAMGSALGALLRDGGTRVVATVSGRSERTVALAEGLELLPSFADVVGASDIVLSVLPPGAAVAVATALAATAERTGAQPLVADLNAVAPRTAREMEARLAEGGLDLVDGSISGPPLLRPGTTAIYLSGARAEEVAALPAAGVQFRVVGEGTASESATNSVGPFCGRRQRGRDGDRRAQQQLADRESRRRRRRLRTTAGVEPFCKRDGALAPSPTRLPRPEGRRSAAELRVRSHRSKLTIPTSGSCAARGDEE